jgi:peptide-methionine (R)-S-oxide reductase
MEGSLNRKQSSPAEDLQTKNIYACSKCGNTLFEATHKFDAGCGYPSFWQHSGGVKENLLQTYGRSRIQLLCNKCDQHLGHLFKSKQTASGVRYCINANAIAWQVPASNNH